MRNFNKKKLFKKYSRGMKMKPAIAVALSHRARLLILDEAIGGLDPIVRDEIPDILEAVPVLSGVWDAVCGFGSDCSAVCVWN